MDSITTNFDESHLNSVNFDFFSLMDYNNNSIDSEFNSIPLLTQNDDKSNGQAVEQSFQSQIIPQMSDKKLCSTSDSNSESDFCSTNELKQFSLNECPKGLQQMSVLESLAENTEHRHLNVVECQSYDCHHCHEYHDYHDNHLSKDLKKIKRIGKRLGLLSGKKGAFSEKKLAHATAESRYRSSINDQIKRLKTLVAGPNANWKKSAILETVAEYIQQLKATNAKLIEENLQLKMKLSQSSGQMTAPSHSYVFVPTLPSLSSASQISTLMYSCI